MPTMADVARCAGVSVATVSHVLNGTRPVLPHTRQAVLNAVDTLGYTPNTLARSLVTSRSGRLSAASTFVHRTSCGCPEEGAGTEPTGPAAPSALSEKGTVS